GATVVAPDTLPQAATQTCPHCGALNVEDALFCESCGYDFTTGTPPMGSDPQPPPEPDSVVGPGEDGYDVQVTSGEPARDDDAPPAEEETEEETETSDEMASILDLPSDAGPSVDVEPSGPVHSPEGAAED